MRMVSTTSRSTNGTPSPHTHRLLYRRIQVRKAGMEQSRGFLPFFDAVGDELRRGRSEVLSWCMAHLESAREAVEYRGYSLQVTYASPQWQVQIGTVLKDRPIFPPERQIV